MRAAIYARYSSDQQREASIEDQLRVCKEFVTRQGWTLVQVYQDRATSGASLLRPGYQGLLQGARTAEFNVIVAEALDRLSRDQEDVAALYKRVSHAGVAIHTLAEGEVSELHIGLKGTMNALFLKDLSNKTRRGLRGRVEAGKSGGGLTYGYDVVSRLDSNGEPVRGERTINEAQAEIVRSVFRDYATGLSPKRIALALNERRVAGPRGGSWAPSTINGNRDRGTGILNNELYVGRLVWNKLTYIKDPDSGKRRSRSNSSAKVVVTAVPELRIVDDALWEAVRARQAALDDRAAEKGGRSPGGMRQKQRPRTLLSGLLQCGECHGGFSKISASAYGCSTARNKGLTACTNLRTIRRDRLEAQVLAGLKQRLMDPGLYETFAREFTAEWNRLQAESNGERSRWITERDKISGQIERLLDAVADGQAGRSVLERISKLEQSKSDIEGRLATMPDVAPRMHPQLASIYRRKVADLTAALSGANGQAAAEIVRGLIKAVVLLPEGGQLRAEVHGELSSILALAAGRDGVARQFSYRTEGLSDAPRRVSAGRGRLWAHSEDEELAMQIKMVAGTGFEPVTFRL